MLFPPRLLVLLSLFLVGRASCHPTRSSPPAKRLNPLTPRRINSGQSISPGPRTVITGLLVSRQSCESGVCPGGQCCPSDHECCGTDNCCHEGSLCCDDTGCCDASDTCCKGGSCCPGSDYCAVSDDGVEGCCPLGQDCSGSPDKCDTSGYVPCANENFCCPPGQTCGRDSNDNPTCFGSQTLTLITTGDSVPSTGRNQPTGTSDGAHRTQVPSSGNGSGFQNVTVDLATEAGITWSGDWVSVGSSCSSRGQGRSLSGNSDSSSSGGIMSYSFTGPCVYLSLSGNNVQYSVSIDGEVTNFVSPSAESQSDCTIGFSRTGMSSGSHDLQIKVSGVNDMRRRGLIEWAFDILQLLITTLASGLLGDASSNVASWPLVLFSALVCLSPYA